MLEQFRTLRFKLTMLYVLIFGLIQSLLWISVDVVRTRYLRDEFDRELSGRTRVLADSIASSVVAGALDPAATQTMIDPFESQDFVFQVRFTDGRMLAGSRWLGTRELPLSPIAAEASDDAAPQIETLAREDGRKVLNQWPVRLVTIRKELPDDRAIYVQGAAGMARLEQTIRTVRSLLFTVVFVSLVIAGITSWHMARRSLQPVADIVRQVRELTSDRLDRRIPVPHGNDEIAEMVRVVNEMLDRLGREFANQQRFISSVSHELKTPLAVLLGEAQAARRLGRDATDLDEFVGMVQQEAGRLVRIVDAFLILTRATSGAGPAVKVRTAIEDVVFEAVKRVQVLADEHGVRVVPTLDLPDDGPEAVVAGDVDLLCSMVENLVRNAIRHNPSGSDVSVAVTVDDSHAHIAVSDCGLGIPVAQLPHIFDLFQPASSDGRRAGKLGIGLSIAQSVARLHGGTITAVNREEGGCEFLVELPLATADSAAD